MSAQVQEAVMEEPTANILANPEGKTVEELKDIARALQVQITDAGTKASQFQSLRDQEVTRRTKAQGALEVIVQLIPEKEIEKMIAEEKETIKTAEKDNKKMNGSDES